MPESPATQYVGSPPELDIARDIVRRGLPAAPVIIAVSALIWGVDGALSSAYGVALVLLNFVLAAAAAGVGRTGVAHDAHGRLARGLPRADGADRGRRAAGEGRRLDLPAPLCLTILITHLGLLFWETRYVSASLAFPALKPPRERS